jgi:LysR family transcriptional regulator (chromosome initiation inhibitor)
MLDYSALSALSAVIREGSFEGAACSLNVTPSAVSQRIRLLEERVGCALIIREQPCRATETGRRLCQHVDSVRLLEHDLQGAVPMMVGQMAPRVMLPVAVNADSLATWLADAIAGFAADHNVLMEVLVDDEDHTAHWLRTGAVLAAVTASARPAAGCNSQALGSMRYIAGASPSFVERYFRDGVNVRTLTAAPSLVFNRKDDLQARWVQDVFQRRVEIPRHTVPSPHAFVKAALVGMGWGMHPQSLIDQHLENDLLVELVPGTPLDISLYWQYARISSGLLELLSHAIISAARTSLLPL